MLPKIEPNRRFVANPMIEIQYRCSLNKRIICTRPIFSFKYIPKHAWQIQALNPDSKEPSHHTKAFKKNVIEGFLNKTTYGHSSVIN